MRLKAELAKKPQVQYLEKPEPQTVRIADENLKEIKYEKDPYLIEQNAKLSRELQNALVEPFNTARRTECKTRSC